MDITEETYSLDGLPIAMAPTADTEAPAPTEAGQETIQLRRRVERLEDGLKQLHRFLDPNLNVGEGDQERVRSYILQLLERDGG